MKSQHDIEQEAAWADGLARANIQLAEQVIDLQDEIEELKAERDELKNSVFQYGIENTKLQLHIDELDEFIEKAFDVLEHYADKYNYEYTDSISPVLAQAALKECEEALKK
jgi:regulator of replication initiation timing